MNREGNNFDWSNETVRKLRQLWDEGHSTAQIGRRLGTTKNAVVGKVHRLQLPTRPSPIKRDSTPKIPMRRRSAPIPKLMEIMPLKLGEPMRDPVVATSLRTPRPKVEPPAAPAPEPTRRAPRPQCCWPIGDPNKPGFSFCDAEAQSRAPYCEKHANKAYVRTPKSEEQATTSSAPVR